MASKVSSSEVVSNGSWGSRGTTTFLPAFGFFGGKTRGSVGERVLFHTIHQVLHRCAQLFLGLLGGLLLQDTAQLAHRGLQFLHQAQGGSTKTRGRMNQRLGHDGHGRRQRSSRG